MRFGPAAPDLRARRPDAHWLLAAPFVVGAVVLVAIPATLALVLSFTEYAGVDQPQWIGLDNYRRMASDPQLRNAAWNTAVFIAIAVPLRVTAATAFALLLHRPRSGIGAARAAVYAPTVIPEVAWALLWLWMLNPVFGPVAAGFDQLGLRPPEMLTDPWTARIALALVAAFQVGEGFVVALAWRRQLSTSPYDAASLAGASPLFLLRRLTLPRMLPVLGLLALRDSLLAVQLGFGPALLITDGGPRQATTYLSTYIFDQSFRWFRLGYGASLSIALLVLTVVVVALAVTATLAVRAFGRRR